VVDGHKLSDLALKGTEPKLQTTPVEIVDVTLSREKKAGTADGGRSSARGRSAAPPRKSSADAAAPATKKHRARAAPKDDESEREDEEGGTSSEAVKAARAPAPKSELPPPRKKPQAAAPLLNDLECGVLVEVRHGYNRFWYKGRIEERKSAGATTKYLIAWCDDDEGTYTPNVPASKIRLPTADSAS